VRRAVPGEQKEDTRIDEYGFDDDSRDVSEAAPVVRNSYAETGKNRYKKEKRDEKAEDSVIRPVVSAGEAEEKFYQKGMASWYGREFHGKVTASGERFDMNEFTAAHKELPFGTVIEVTNLKTGHRARVKINDRGPYRGSRIIDLSFAAAKEMGFIREGEAMVGINVVKWGQGARKDSGVSGVREGGDVEPVADYSDMDDADSHKPSYSVRNGGLSVQTGAFYSRRNAENLKKKLEGLTERSVVIVNDGDLFKVRIEGLADEREISKTRKALNDEKYTLFCCGITEKDCFNKHPESIVWREL
jgi:rare lipoprotein A